MWREAIVITGLLLIALPWMPPNSLQGILDTDSSHEQMLAPAENGSWTELLWLNGGSATQSTERAEDWGQMPGPFGTVTGEAGGRAVTAKLKLNYLGVDLITLGVCRGKAVPWPPRVGATPPLPQ